MLSCLVNLRSLLSACSIDQSARSRIRLSRRVQFSGDAGSRKRGSAFWHLVLCPPHKTPHEITSVLIAPIYSPVDLSVCLFLFCISLPFLSTYSISYIHPIAEKMVASIFPIYIRARIGRHTCTLACIHTFIWERAPLRLYCIHRIDPMPAVDPKWVSARCISLDGRRLPRQITFPVYV